MTAFLGTDDDGSKNVAKKEFASFQTLSRLFEPAQFVKYWRFLLGLNSYRPYPASKLGETSSKTRRRHAEVSRRSRAVDV